MPDQEAQSATNHTRWDPLFHFVIMPFILISVIALGVRLYNNPDGKHLWLLGAGVVALLLALKTRLNALKVQDRLIRLEEKLRLATLMNDSQKQYINQVTERQFVALRFASDGEVAALAERAVKENLDSKQIKAAIQSWRADNFRV
jgi:hypothetical protein